MARTDELILKKEEEKQFLKGLLEHTISNFKGEVKTASGTSIFMKSPPIYDNVEVLHDAIESYWQKIAEKAEKGVYIVPDVEDFCEHAGISRATFRNWQTPGYKSLDFYEEINRLATGLAAYKKQLAYKGMIPQVFALADLNNNHDYTNQTQVIRHEIDNRLPSIEEVMNKLPPAE